MRGWYTWRLFQWALYSAVLCAQAAFSYAHDPVPTVAAMLGIVTGLASALFTPRRWSWARVAWRRFGIMLFPLGLCAVFVVAIPVVILDAMIGRPVLLIVLHASLHFLCTGLVIAILDNDSDDHRDAIKDASDAVRNLVERVRAVHGPAAVPSGSPA